MTVPKKCSCKYTIDMGVLYMKDMQTGYAQFY